MGLIENIKIINDTVIEISIEVFEVTKLLINILITVKIKNFSRRQFKRLRRIERDVNRLFHNVIKYKDTQYYDNIILGLAYLLIYWIYENILKDKELVYDKRTCLIRCLELLKEKESDYTVILLAIRVLNYLGNTYLNSNKPEVSIPIFERILQLYLEFKKKKEYPIFLNIFNIFGLENNINPKILIEEIYITVLEKLMKASENIFQADEHTLVLYKLKYLNQHLMFIPLTVGYLNFIGELLSVSEYFLLRDHFTKAKNCLATACWLLKRFYLEGCQKDKEKLKVMMNITYQDMDKKVAKYWGRYGLVLLHSSIEQLSQNKEENESSEVNNLKLGSPTKFNEQFIELTLFADIGENLKKYSLITDKYLTHYTEAKDVFTHVIDCFNKAKIYYTPDKHKMEYVTIIQDISKACKYFAYYEQDLHKQIHLHIMRINNLENAITILNKSDCNIRKQIYIELGVTYSTLLILTQNAHVHDIAASVSFPRESAALSILNFQLYLH